MKVSLIRFADPRSASVCLLSSRPFICLSLWLQGPMLSVLTAFDELYCVVAYHV